MNGVVDQLAPAKYSPYRVFSADDWAKFRADTPLTLSADEVGRLRSLGDPIDLDEVSRIYLAVSRLISAHVESSQLLFRQRQRFLSGDESGRKTPFIIGIAGSVAVGKSTTARILKELMTRWPSSPKVDLVTTDGFLFPNAVLQAEGLMQRKGFPESYDVGAILRFLSDIKAGRPRVEAPVYSHFVYDVVPDQHVVVDRPDILIFEGLNVLQVREMPKDGKAIPFVSDFFDISIYIDADEAEIVAGISSGSCGCARPPSGRKPRSSTAIPRSRTPRRWPSPRACGATSTARISTRTSCRRGRAPT